ncbi:MAG: type I-E CRISPR-associated protein Cse1/CasA [Sphaerochaeta sp.]|nr:type I-E CRISPR-associated protein Cse1/CasA [Sphaerochaeta sp.]
MNLITDAWIPVRRRDSQERELIRPYEIVERLEDDPFVRVDSTRPDFNGALTQFLIGIIQTVMTPVDEVEWVERFIDPPSTEELQQVMEPISKFFELEGTSIRFMQEVGMESGIKKTISSLLIDTPGASTIKDNTDHFIKRNRVEGMCEVCAATALYTLNTNAPKGGQGNFVSMRGGGPLTIIAMPDGEDGSFDTLWHTILLNVLIKQDLKMTGCNDSLVSFDTMFPWVSSRRENQSEAINATARTINPLHAYWGMPRRTFLDAPEQRLGTCDICGKRDTQLFRTYESKPRGIFYGDSGILHPLSPYRSNNEGLLLPVLPQPGGFTYRHWPLYITSNDPLNPRPITLRVLDGHLRDLRQMNVELGASVKVFGYDMGDMKPRCWYEATMPYWLVPDEIRDILVEYSSRLAEAAAQVARYTRSAVKEVWFSKESKVKAEPDYVETEFWDATEDEFYQSVQSMIEALPSGDQDVLERWLATIGKVSLEVFDRYADQVPLDSGGQKDKIPRSIEARNVLIRNNSGKKVRETILGLPGKKEKK